MPGKDAVLPPRLSLTTGAWFLGIVAVGLAWAAWLRPGHALVPFLPLAWPGAYESAISEPVWRWLLPQRALGGSYSNSGLLLFRWLELHTGGTLPALLFTLVLQSVGVFAAVRECFRSNRVALVSVFLLLFSDFNYHAYYLSGSLMEHLVLAYVAGLVFFAVRFLRDGRPVHLACGAPFLALLFLSYESWLDFLVWAGLALGAYVLWSRKIGGEAPLRRRAFGMFLATGVVFVTYVLVKMAFGYGQVAGSESDVALNYFPRVVPIVEDLLGNLFEQTYLALSFFLPPFLTGSNSLFAFGKDWLIEQQRGYHADHQQLTYMSHVFFWRYYAGAACLLVAMALVRMVRRSVAARDSQLFVLALLVAAFPFGSFTHSLTKYRPFNSQLLLGYHVWWSIAAGCVLVALLFERVLARVPAPVQRRWMTGFVLYFVVCAAWRPDYLRKMGDDTGFPGYKTPSQQWRSWFQGR